MRTFIFIICIYIYIYVSYIYTYIQQTHCARQCLQMEERRAKDMTLSNKSSERPGKGGVTISMSIWVWLEKLVPKWNPGKWKHGPKPA